MSSNFMSRPVDVSKYGLIYAGAQKNIGPAGITMVIVRDDLLGKTSDLAPSLFNYEKQAGSDSMVNTVPTFCWYVCGLVFKWLKNNGGLEAMEQLNIRKASKLYACIDSSNGFYTNNVEVSSRSRMNVPFILKDASLDADFLDALSIFRLLSFKLKRLNKHHPTFAKDLIVGFEDILNDGFFDEL